jgi:DNA polymerase
MSTPKRAIVNYLNFLKNSGFLYMEQLSPDELAAAMEHAATLGQARHAAAAPPAPARHPASPAHPQRAKQPALPGLAAPPAPARSAPARREPDLAGPPLALEARQQRIREAMARAEACRACPLGAGRNKLVYGVGDPMARIVFVGEAPGGEEDMQGIPFVGRAGQLLTKMLAAIGFSRDEVYICNTAKCRPPGNRDPLPAEKEACEHFLVEQLAILRPQILVALGAHAAQYLCRSEETIGNLRGCWREYHGVPLLATYHPAFLLRSPGFKLKSWDDFQEIHKKYTELNPGDERKLWAKEG